MILQSVQGRVVGNDLLNISPSNIFLSILLAERFHQKCLAAVSIDGLRS